MAARQALSDPHEESRLRLDSWASRAFLRFSPLTGDESASRLVEALLSEYLGRWIEEIAPEGFTNGFGPSYQDLRAFFLRFAPDVASYLPATISSSSMKSLRLIQIALCARIVSEDPETLGRSGRVLLSREWRQIEADLPLLEAARTKVASTPDGEAAESACRRELVSILGKMLRRLD